MALGVLSDVGLAQLTVFEEEGADSARVVIGHADSYPHLDHYLEIIRRGANIEVDFLGMSFTPQELHGESRLRERGVSEAEIDQMTVTNPRRILTIS